jgi:hypothetical protein
MMELSHPRWLSQPEHSLDSDGTKHKSGLYDVAGGLAPATVAELTSERGRAPMARVCSETMRPGTRKVLRAQAMPPTAADQQLAAEIKELRGDFHKFGMEVTEKLGKIDTGIAERLGAINTSLNTSFSEFRGRIENSLAVARWVSGAALTIGLAVIGWGVLQDRRATHLESSVESIKESIALLRDHAKQQDERIAKLIELQSDKEKPPSSGPTTVPTHPKDVESPKRQRSGDNRPAAPIAEPAVSSIASLIDPDGGEGDIDDSNPSEDEDGGYDAPDDRDGSGDVAPPRQDGGDALTPTPGGSVADDIEPNSEAYMRSIEDEELEELRSLALSYNNWNNGWNNGWGYNKWNNWWGSGWGNGWVNGGGYNNWNNNWWGSGWGYGGGYNNWNL